jgi:hypothetical protein
MNIVAPPFQIHCLDSGETSATHGHLDINSKAQTLDNLAAMMERILWELSHQALSSVG